MQSSDRPVNRTAHSPTAIWAAIIVSTALCSTVAIARPPSVPPPPTPTLSGAPADHPATEVPVVGAGGPSLPHHSPPVRVAGSAPRVVVVSDLPPAPPRSEDDPRTSPSQGGDAYAAEADQFQPTQLPGEQRASIYTQDPAPQLETVDGQFLGNAVGSHVREWEGINDTGSFPPDPVTATGSQHVVEAVNRGFSVYDKFGNELLDYRTFNDLFSPGAGFSLFDPKVIWSSFHGKFALLALGRNTNTQDSRFYLAISQTANALGAWWTYSYDAEALGDGDAWLDYESLGGDLWGLYVTGQMLNWDGSGTKHSKLWAISPNAWTGGSAPSWIWLDLEWGDGSNARMLEMAHPHTEAFDEASFFVNTRVGSGSDALIWKLVGDRHSGAGLSLTRSAVDIDDYDAIAGNIDQPGSVTDIHGFFTQPNNAVYVNRRLFFSLTTDVLDDTTASGLLTTRIHVDNLDVEWDDMHWSGAGQYYFFPALAFQGSSTSGNMALFYSYTRPSNTTYASAGYKVFDDQPNSDSGPNVLFQNGLAPYVRIDSFGRNRWGDYASASYDWQCGHLWGVAEYAGTGNQWRTRMKALNGGGEGACALMSVVSPNGGESLFAGDTVLVDWERSAVPAGTEIFVLFDNGSTTTTISPALPTTASSFSWSVPNEPTTEGRIWVGAWDGASWALGDWSDLDFTIVGRPDLVTQVAGPASAIPGETIAVSNGISNIGEAAGAINVSVVLSTNATCSTLDTLLATRIGGSLQPGQVSNSSTNATLPSDLSLGTYHLCAYADWSNTQVEFNESNNTSVTPISIVADEIFADGFESGSTAAWSAITP